MNVLVDYDHDYDLDLIALGPKAVLMRNQGPAGYQPAEFPFVEGEALSGVTFESSRTPKASTYWSPMPAHEAVLYRDKLQGHYTAELIAVPQKATNVATADLNNDGWIDVVYAEQDGTHVAWNKKRKFEPAAANLPRGRHSLSQTSKIAAQSTSCSDERCCETTARVRSRLVRPNCRQNVPLECRDFDNDGRMDLACGTKQFLNRTQHREFVDRQ